MPDLPAPAIDEARPLRWYQVFSYRYEQVGRGPVLFGLIALIPFVVIFLTWSSLAPLSAAAIADGQVILNFDRKTVQHLEGGMVDRILVQEGQEVSADEPILVIRDLPQRVQVDTLRDQIASNRSLLARLRAERDELDEIDFDGLGDDLDLAPEALDKLVTLQSRLFRTRRESLTSKADLVRSQQEQTRNEITGLNAQLKADRKQHALITEEYQGVLSLNKQGYSTRTKQLEMEKALAELEGEMGATVAGIARLEQGIIAAETQLLDLYAEFRKSVLDTLQNAELTLRELTHQYISTKDQLTRTVIRAPSSGRVMDLQVHTVGAVISPGERILDIVPNDDRMIVEARVNPNDIDLVSPGVNTKIQLSAFKAKKVPKIDGVVETVSADIHQNEMSGERFFLARVVVDETAFDELKAEIALYPGMPAQVFFLQGPRTLADYLISPITDAAYRAFREE